MVGDRWGNWKTFRSSLIGLPLAPSETPRPGDRRRQFQRGRGSSRPTAFHAIPPPVLDPAQALGLAVLGDLAALLRSREDHGFGELLTRVPLKPHLGRS